MTKKLLLILMCCVGSRQLMAQSMGGESPKKFQPTEIGVALGLSPGFLRNTAINDINAFTPGSNLLLKANGMQSNPLFLSGLDAHLQIWAGFALKGKADPLLRLGLSYTTMQNDLRSYGRSYDFVYDTLYSTNGTHVVYADSMYSEWLFVEQFTQHLRLDAALLWHSKNKGPFSLFAGVGGQAGLSVLSRSRVTYHHTGNQRYRAESDSMGSGFWLNMRVLEHSTEIFGNGLQFISSVYLPIGISLRLGAAGSPLEKVQLFIQYTPSFTLLHLPEHGWVSAQQLFGQLGMRFAL